jgi:hypothetical protein
MKLSLYSPLVVALLSLMLVNVSPVSAQTAAPAKVKKIPFHGKLEAVDTSAQTVTVAGKTPRVFHVTPDTKITDGAKNATTLAAAVVGEDVGGSYTKDTAGTMTLFSLRLGAKEGSKTATSTPEPAAAAAATPAPAPAAPEPSAAPATAKADTTTTATPAAATAATATAKVKKQTFSGKVVSVDIIAHTLVVHGKADQTFVVNEATKYTGVDGLSSITAGQKVSGSYTKSADGATNTVATLKIK